MGPPFYKLPIPFPYFKGFGHGSGMGMGVPFLGVPRISLDEGLEDYFPLQTGDFLSFHEFHVNFPVSPIGSMLSKFHRDQLSLVGNSS